MAIECEDDALAAIVKLHAFGPPTVVLTSLNLDSDTMTAYVSVSKGNTNYLYWNVPCGDTSSKALIDVCVCVRRHIAKLRQE